jgi:hypothetical protein
VQTPPPAATASSKPAPPSWRDALGAGRSDEAIALLERDGVEPAFATASATELEALADAARLARRPQLARSALLTLRNRHAARGQSAFLLGKIAADQLAAPGEATRWFETYLREAASGPLAEQAQGRLVELYGRVGSPEAQRAARRYLDRYPAGAYADLARRALHD